MKRKILKSPMLVGLLSLMACFPSLKKDTLKDITKPYLGVYECTEARWNEEDCLNRFSYIHLELKGDGTFILYYCEKDGEKRKETGRYHYDKEKSALTLMGRTGMIKREFPLKEGVLTVNIAFGGDNLNMQFEQK
ncbi:MAG: hypothetical protein IJ284_00100 [Clostridia bacterium]|nr:hypothetical protein [Clostridia bacterium]